MATPFFTAQEATGHLVVSHDLWKYFVVALPLTVLTLFFWRLEVYRMRRHRDKAAAKIASSVV
jgi:hypothetical protein